MADSQIPRARTNELTGVLRRNRFDDPPGDVTDPADLARWRAFRAAYHRAANLDAPSAFPLQLDFELTSRCNFRCAFCPHGQEAPIPKRELTFERFARAIDEGERYGLVSTKLNYINEPLMTRDLPRYVRYAKDHGVLNVYFATNGALLNERIRGELIDAGVSKIMISLDAVTPETFRAVRRSEQYALIVRNIRALLDERERRGISYPLVRANFLKTALNVHEAEEFVRQWTDVADMVGLQDQVGLPGVESDLLTSGPYVDHSEFRCSFPFKMLVIDSAGHILPCCTFSGREMPLGHVDDVSLHDAWVGERMLALRRLHAEGAWRQNPICAHCVLGATS